MLDRSIYPDCYSAAKSVSRKSSASSAELCGPQQLTLAQLLWPRTTSIAPLPRQPQQHTSSSRHAAVGNEVMMFHNTWRNGEGVNTSCLLHLILNNPFWQGDNFVSILNRFIKWEITSLQGGNNVSTFSKVFCMCSIVKRGSHVWSPAPALLHHYETANSSWWRGASAWQLAAAVHDTAWPGAAACDQPWLQSAHEQRRSALSNYLLAGSSMISCRKSDTVSVWRLCSQPAPHHQLTCCKRKRTSHSLSES